MRTHVRVQGRCGRPRALDARARATRGALQACSHACARGASARAARTQRAHARAHAACAYACAPCARCIRMRRPAAHQVVEPRHRSRRAARRRLVGRHNVIYIQQHLKRRLHHGCAIWTSAGVCLRGARPAVGPGAGPARAAPEAWGRAARGGVRCAARPIGPRSAAARAALRRERLAYESNSRGPQARTTVPRFAISVDWRRAQGGYKRFKSNTPAGIDYNACYQGGSRRLHLADGGVTAANRPWLLGHPGVLRPMPALQLFSLWFDASSAAQGTQAPSQGALSNAAVRRAPTTAPRVGAPRASASLQVPMHHRRREAAARGPPAPSFSTRASASGARAAATRLPAAWHTCGRRWRRGDTGVSKETGAGRL